GGALGLYRVGNRRSRGVVVGQFDRNAGAGNHARGNTGGVLRSEAGVIADDHTAFTVLVVEHVRGDRAGDAAHVVEGKIVGDYAAPPVGAELDVRHSCVGLLAMTCDPLTSPELGLDAGDSGSVDKPSSNQLLQPFFVQVFDDFADVLRMFPSGNLQRIGCVDH